MTYQQARYVFEHQMLTSWFYQKKISFLGAVIQNKSFFYRAFCDILNRQGIDVPVKEEEFSFALFPLSEETVMLVLDLPRPRAMNQCRTMYFCFDVEFRRPAVFTLELSYQCWYLCAWTANHIHLNYGECRPAEAFGRVRRLYEGRDV